MKKMLVTGGTVFVSKYIASYFAHLGFDVFVLNRNTRPQPEHSTLIQADRHNLGSALNGHSFDIVIDTAYTKEEMQNLLDALAAEKSPMYVFISSSAVYPETLPQPFKESALTGKNSIWKDYGTHKIEAEEYLFSRMKDAYILRPPYLYGPMNNLYREAFVFECAEKGRTFYLPKDGSLQLQFLYIEDLCRIIQTILDTRPQQHILNVGNSESVLARDWVRLCYEAVGVPLNVQNVTAAIEQRNFFPFYDYEYKLDVTLQQAQLSHTTSLKDGLAQSYNWYRQHKDAIVRKDFIAYIDSHLATEGMHS